MAFKNTYLSYSRIDKYAKCPQAFRWTYVDRREGLESPAANLGSAVHWTLEQIVNRLVSEGEARAIPEGWCHDAWHAAAVGHRITHPKQFEEGHAMVLSWREREGVIAPDSVMAVEQKFTLKAGDYTVIGYIDRVNRLDDDTVEIVDYKTNRGIFTREETEDALQLTLYAAAARQLWPWAKRVVLSYDMLRHGFKMRTERTEEQVDAGVKYMAAMGALTEQDREFVAQLNSFCSWCEFRRCCPEYMAAARGEIAYDTAATPKQLEDIAAERERINVALKAAEARKKELEAMLRPHLESHDEVILAGSSYSLKTYNSTSYDTQDAAEILARAAGVPESVMVRRIASVSVGKMKAELKALAKTDPNAALSAEATLELCAKVEKSQRLTVKKVK